MLYLVLTEDTFALKKGLILLVAENSTAKAGYYAKLITSHDITEEKPFYADYNTPLHIQSIHRLPDLIVKSFLSPYEAVKFSQNLGSDYRFPLIPKTVDCYTVHPNMKVFIPLPWANEKIEALTVANIVGSQEEPLKYWCYFYERQWHRFGDFDEGNSEPVSNLFKDRGKCLKFVEHKEENIR